MKKKELIKNTDDEVVTRGILKQELEKFRVSFKAEILAEVRIMIYGAMAEMMESMKLYYQNETNRHLTALKEGFMDEMRIYRDELIGVRNRVELLENK